MKRKIKKALFSVLLSVLCGAICGRLVYQIYDEKIDTELRGEKVYLVQAGAYSTYDNMIENTSSSQYVYYEDDDGLYKSIIGITENYNNIDKIKNTYPKEVIVSEYYSKDEELNKKIKEYDKKINATTDNKEIKEIVLEMIELYKGNDSVLTGIKT